MYPGFGVAAMLVLGHGWGGLILQFELCRSAHTEGERRRRRLWKISRYSKIALANSMRVRHRLRPGNLVCILPQKDSIIAS